MFAAITLCLKMLFLPLTLPRLPGLEMNSVDHHPVQVPALFCRCSPVVLITQKLLAHMTNATVIFDVLRARPLDLQGRFA